MPFEIDFLPVGDASKSGDSIALRYGYGQLLPGQQTVAVIDGGTQEAGGKLVEHIRREYSSDRVDYAILTHADLDHVAGLKVVVEEMDVRFLFMHRPWEHAAAIRDMFASSFSTTRLAEKIRRALEAAHDLEQLARRRRIQIMEPFAGGGTRDGAVTFLGPTQDYYQSLICAFRETPEPSEGMVSVLSVARATARSAVRWIKETLSVETLEDNGETSAENNSSVISLFHWDGQQVLFTADAGIPALTRAADFAGIDLTRLNLLQIPHHGSRRNVGPTILDRVRALHAVISVCKDGAPKHPSKKVINALIRRGTGVYCTSGKLLNYSAGSNRYFNPAVAETFSEYVEE